MPPVFAVFVQQMTLRHNDHVNSEPVIRDTGEKLSRRTVPLRDGQAFSLKQEYYLEQPS